MIRASVGSLDTPSIAFGVSRKEEILISGAFGYADVSTKRLASTSTPYALASISKPITATGVMALVERGQLELEAPINDYLGSSHISSRAGEGSGATVRRVGDHSSGLPLHYQYFYNDEQDRPPPFSETIRRYAKTFSIPGERFQYSNLGYGLFDHIIARVSGLEYADFMAEQVFEPFGMQHASVYGTHGCEVEVYGLDGVPFPRYQFDHPGGSSIWASVEDLIRFGQIHLGLHSSPLTLQRIKAMQQQSYAIDSSRGWGFGWGLNRDYFGLGVVQHDGAMSGVRTILRLVPELDAVIVVLANGESSMPLRVADQFLAAISSSFEAGFLQNQAKPVSRVQKEALNDSVLGKWSGWIETYAERLPLVLEFQSGTGGAAVLGAQSLKIEDLQTRLGRIVGSFRGDVGTADTSRGLYRLHLDLKARGNILNGAVVAVAFSEDGFGGQLGRRPGSALSHWTELSR